jgi:DNA-binding NtrC family response regulator
MPFVGRDMTLGRADACEGRLVSKQVSRRHARLRRAGPAWILSDTDSRNGVYLNAVRVSEAPVSEGDIVRIGDWVGTVISAEASFVPGGAAEPVAVAGARMREVLRQVEAVASSKLPVLVLGETGTGKEVVARAIHEWSGRRGAFVPVNCAALPESLAEAMLFGHKRGAFTGADRESSGFFGEADGGTLLLDEACDLPLSIQAKLLRALEDQVITPVGSAKPVAVDVRIVAAAHLDLADRVEDGRFRDDVYARLQGLELHLPPLRERREEIVPLFLHYLHEQWDGDPPRLQPELLERLLLRDWSLNVRELVQVARQVAILHQGKEVLTEDHLPPRVTRSTPPRSTRSVPPPEPEHSDGASRKQRAEASRQRELERLLEALELGMQRRQAYRLLDLRPDIDLARFRGRTT